MSQRKSIGRRIAQVPAPRLLNQSEMEALKTKLIDGTLTKDQAWSMYHLLVLTLNVQTDLINRLVATGIDDKDARVLLRADYEKRLKQYQGALLAVHEPEPSARPS